MAKWQPGLQRTSASQSSLCSLRDRFDIYTVRRTLLKFAGRRAPAAAELGVTRCTLYRILRRDEEPRKSPATEPQAGEALKLRLDERVRELLVD